MTASGRRRMVRMVRELATLLRKDAPSEWPGLPTFLGAQPSRLGANIFMLGCSVDGGRQPAGVAWRAAQRFVLGIVPKRDRNDIWNWILRKHTAAEWRRKRRMYGLHRTRMWHARVYRFAGFLSVYLNGDPRELWRKVPHAVQPIDHVRSLLFAMRFGPALSRMLVGALLDHGLLKGETAFKEDIHVRRAMYQLGLAPSQESYAVLEAGERLFGKNSWEIDLAFYRLGEQGYKTRKQIERYYRERVREKRDKRVADLWQQHRDEWLGVVREAVGRTKTRLRDVGWRVSSSHGKGYLGFSVVRTNGPLALEFREGSLQVWSGVVLNVPEASIEGWTEVGFDIDASPSRSLVFRDQLRTEGYMCSYNDEDGWETHHKLAGEYSIWTTPGKLSRALAGALARGTAKTVEMLESVGR